MEYKTSISAMTVSQPGCLRRVPVEDQLGMAFGDAANRAFAQQNAIVLD
jgi:hypothetical protein